MALQFIENGVGIVGGPGATNDGSALAWCGEKSRQDIERETDLLVETAIQIALQVAQLIIYWGLYDDAIDNRDDAIDDQLDFMDYLETTRETQDLPMLNTKAGILTGLVAPASNRCADVVMYAGDSENDGYAVDEKAIQLSHQSCGGIPPHWGTHEGSLMGASAGCYAGGIIANSSKRREESFTFKKNDLVLEVHNGLKSSYNANEILGKYAQRAAIFSGLADIYIQGFNSAGAGLGVAIGKLRNGTGNGVNTSNGMTNASHSTGVDPRGL